MQFQARTMIWTGKPRGERLKPGRYRLLANGEWHTLTIAVPPRKQRTRSRDRYDELALARAEAKRQRRAARG